MTKAEAQMQIEAEKALVAVTQAAEALGRMAELVQELDLPDRRLFRKSSLQQFAHYLGQLVEGPDRGEILMWAPHILRCLI